MLCTLFFPLSRSSLITSLQKRSSKKARSWRSDYPCFEKMGGVVGVLVLRWFTDRLLCFCFRRLSTRASLLLLVAPVYVSNGTAFARTSWILSLELKPMPSEMPLWKPSRWKHVEVRRCCTMAKHRNIFVLSCLVLSGYGLSCLALRCVVLCCVVLCCVVLCCLARSCVVLRCGACVCVCARGDIRKYIPSSPMSVPCSLSFTTSKVVFVSSFCSGYAYPSIYLWRMSVPLSLSILQPDDTIQLERRGYFRVDSSYVAQLSPSRLAFFFSDALRALLSWFWCVVLTSSPTTVGTSAHKAHLFCTLSPMERYEFRVGWSYLS